MNVVVMLFLIILIFINVFTAFSSFKLIEHVIKYENISPFAGYGLLLSKIVSCLFIVLLFKWNMWGFYGLLAISIIQFVIILMFKSSVLTACIPFVYLAITYLVLQISQNGETAWDNLE